MLFLAVYCNKALKANIRTGTFWSVCAGYNCFWAIKTSPDPSMIETFYQVNIPVYYVLSLNYPNPFNLGTTIKFTLPKADLVTLKIYNIPGNEVDSLVSEKLAAGKYKYMWEAGNFAIGVFVYQLKTVNMVKTKKMVLCR